MTLYKLNKLLHRDLGYFFVVMTLIYAISGIAINHRADWNPNYIINKQLKSVKVDFDRNTVNDEKITKILNLFGEEGNYKSHFFPNDNTLRIFINGGNITVDLITDEAYLETIKPRPLLKELNYLHYNPGRIWTWFSDIFCVALSFLAISGLFILKGKNGLKWRGTIFLILGLIIPLVLLFMYL